MSETSELVRPALIALCKQWPEGVWTRRNVGAARFRSRKGEDYFVRFNRPGMADIYGIWNRLAWELEAKLPGEAPNEAQDDWGRAVMRAGGIYIVFNDVGYLIHTIQRRWRETLARDRQVHSALGGGL